MDNSITRLAIDDALSLLQQACECPVQWNQPNAAVVLELPDLAIQAKDSSQSPWAKKLNYPILAYPRHDFRWTSQQVAGERIHLRLQTHSAQGIAFALYGLLQEQLWFSFYHPREHLIPKLLFWPLSANFDWTSEPRFDKKGFHLHTMHPIELSEALLNPDMPNGMRDIKAYIDWLLRNGQNYFEFNVLSSIDEKRWHTYIGEAVRYAHERGILIGIDLSLHMRQQKAYKLYRKFPKSWRSKRSQIARSLARFFVNDWDVVSLEFSETEFSAGKPKKREALRRYVTDLLENRYHAKLLGREHVVRKEHFIGKKDSSAQQAPDTLDQKRGLLVHTVMFYGLEDESAPVYKNHNLQHMASLLKKEHSQRETWYYPESAYWVTFDNSVPMLLLPYLSARLRDIQYCDSLNITGHLTFSSGWEWGYWLVDWSIARWSWRQKFDGKALKNTPLQYTAELFRNDAVTPHLQRILNLQEHYIKDGELIRYLAPSTITDELPMRWHKKLEFQPRPQMRYKDWHKTASKAQLDSLKTLVIDSLAHFGRENERLLIELLEKRELYEHVQQELVVNEPKPLLEELLRALRVTGLRAQHRAATLDFMRTWRMARLNKDTLAKDFKEQGLRKARELRQEAQAMVREQEQWYRYRLEVLAGRARNKTAYDFGYLYPVSTLHFWRREENQASSGKYGPFRDNIWNVWRIMGLRK